jgi:DNA-directed RNA polymerase sigma subunit (sigma70/sigma32)
VKLVAENERPLFLQLDKEYRITTDKYNFILERLEDVIDRKTREVKGKEWKDVGYFGSNIKATLNKYVVEKVKKEEHKDINKLIDKLDEIERTIIRVVKRENIKLEVSEAN